MHTIEIKRAPLSSFRNLRSTVLFGKALEDVKQIERSIAQFGMLMPITVTKAKNSFIVIDGKKRLSALKRMEFAGTLPRSLVETPYLFVEEAQQFGRGSVSVLSSQELYRAVETLKSGGDEIEAIAKKLYLCRRTVQEILHLTHLCDVVKHAFFRRAISFEQAYAFSTMPCHITQKRTFLTLGPFANVTTILDTIQEGGTSPNGDIAENAFPLLTGNEAILSNTSHALKWHKAA